MNISPFFYQVVSRSLFTLKFIPDLPSSSRLLIIPPFAEEMNKSRRMMVMMAKKACEQGCEVILPDLYGTGDSEGGFSDASWDAWLEDLELCIEHLRSQRAQINILALRSGALLATDLIAKASLTIEKLILWQPVNSGDVWLTQFLRLRLASSMMGASGDKETVKDLKAKLDQGESIEVAGYEVSPALAEGLINSKLDNFLPTSVNAVTWLELVANEGKSILPVGRKVIDKWSAHTLVCADTVVGPVFWNSVEIVDVPALIDRTMDSLKQS